MPYPSWPNVPGTWSPNQYAQYRYPSPSPQYQQQQPQQGNLLWVNGNDGAKAYPMQPNMSVLLLDSSGPYAYLKSTDAANFPTIERFRVEKDPIHEVVDVQPQNQYATHEEVSALSSKIDGLVALLEPMRTKPISIDVKGETYAEPDIRKPSAATTASEPGNGPSRVNQGGDDWGL